MAPIRVLLGEMSPLFGSMIAELMDDAVEIDLVAATHGSQDLIANLDVRNVDVVILREADVKKCGGLLAQVAKAAPIGIVSVNEEGQGGTSYRVLREDVAFSHAPGQQLICAVKMAAGRG